MPWLVFWACLFKRLAFAALAIIAIARYVGIVVFQRHTFSVNLPEGPAVFETSLQDRINSSDTSLTIVANRVRGGPAFTGYHVPADQMLWKLPFRLYGPYTQPEAALPDGICYDATHMGEAGWASGPLSRGRSLASRS